MKDAQFVSGWSREGGGDESPEMPACRPMKMPVCAVGAKCCQWVGVVSACRGRLQKTSQSREMEIFRHMECKQSANTAPFPD